jgi:hypothetical protein
MCSVRQNQMPVNRRSDATRVLGKQSFTARLSFFTLRDLELFRELSKLLHVHSDDQGLCIGVI